MTKEEHSSLIYLRDANTLIDAKRDYFQFERVPEFWEWIIHHGQEGNIKIPIEIYEEFEEARNPDGTRDPLSEWSAAAEVKEALLFPEEAAPTIVAEVINDGYADDLNDEEIEKVGRDPFLISYAASDPTNRVIVSTEISKPSKRRANRKVPDVCSSVGIRCINNFMLLQELDFKTGWNN